MGYCVNHCEMINRVCPECVRENKDRRIAELEAKNARLKSDGVKFIEALAVLKHLCEIKEAEAERLRVLLAQNEKAYTISQEMGLTYHGKMQRAEDEAEHLRTELWRLSVEDFVLTPAQVPGGCAVIGARCKSCGIRTFATGKPLDPANPHTGEFCADTKGSE